MATPAGWYTDPSGRYAVRYWDGFHWTGHVSGQALPAIDPLEPTDTRATTEMAAGGETPLLTPHMESRSERQARLRGPRQRRRRVVLLGAGVSALGLFGVAAFASSGANDGQVATSPRSVNSVPHTEVTYATVATTTTAPPTTLPPTTSAPTTTATRAAPPAPTTTATRAAPPPPLAVPASPTSSGCYRSQAGNCVKAGQYCPTALRGQTVQGESEPLVCLDNNGWRWVAA